MFLDDGSGPPVLLLASLRLAVTDHEKQSPWIGSFQLASSVLAPRSDGLHLVASIHARSSSRSFSEVSNAGKTALVRLKTRRYSRNAGPVPFFGWSVCWLLD